MAKIFEDEFMEAQADMVSICLEYVEDDAEKIYIYVSIDIQRQCSQIILDDIDKIKCICEKYNQPMPTQFKLVYDVAKNSLDTHYEYENQYSDDPYKSSWDVAEEWFEQVKAQEEGSAQ